ncbi:ATP-binding domain-containing protein [Cupriavidus sp. 2TAF22]|uniref:ATP-binding domain-containing protein n=1 Tax=unclassified Cupriavidus TaxID=2640874 RepID=UPI003F8EDD13
MARVIPDGWETMEASGPVQRELETLAVLAAGLPDGYTIYHSVHWTNVANVHAIYGEIDFVVVNRAGQLLIIEQKSGFLEETAEGLVKNYGTRSKVVSVQMGRTADGLRSKLMRSLNGQAVFIEHLLYCPDYTVRNPVTAGLSPQRIVDADRRAQLCQIIQAILPEGEAEPGAERVHRFLCDTIQLETDVSALIGQARSLVTRVSGGLAHWARQLDIEPFRLRVTGTAGSGKTQLALAEYRDAIARGQRPLYVCFNRPLADHFARIAPAGGLACTFHMLCELVFRHHGGVPDFTQPDAFARLVADVERLVVPPGFVFDTVIVDEGQDFAPQWRDLVLRHAAPAARAIWLEDPMQNLYGHPPAELPGWVRLRARSNFRSPRPVVKLLQPLLPPEVEIEATAPISTADVEFLVYQDHELLDRVKDGMRMCYSAGFRQQDVVLLSYRGRETSRLLCYDQLGPNKLRSFTGGYDAQGQPVYSQGDVLAESVFRFKGQSAPAIVFAEIDFESMGEKEIRRLFVGATRATMKLVLVLSERAAGLLYERL